MRSKLSLLSLALVLFSFGMVQGQSLSLDHVDGLYAPDTIPVGQQVTFYIRVTGDASNHGGITNGFQIYSPDGATWGSTVADTMPLHWSQWFSLIFSINRFSFDGAGADTVGFGGSYNPLNSVGLPAGFDSVSYKITIGPIDSQYNGKTIILDSCFYPPIGTWKWAGPDAYPSWDGPHVYTIYDPNAQPPANLALSPGSLNFTAQEGDGILTPQSFNVAEAAGGSIAFTASESASWFNLSTTSGTTPQDVSVNVDATGLTAGTYTDSIMISSTDAVNSPQYEIVNLTVTPAPKYLATSPTPLNFNAVEGGTNPTPQSFTVSEQGGASISFTPSEGASWFSLSGVSGTTPNDIQVNVDITGLAAGTYTDSIEIASAEAANSPIYEVINLTLAPSPKTLAVTPTVLNFSAPEGGPNPTAQTFGVSEAGGAAISYVAYRSTTPAGWIGIADSTGTTPGTVSVNVDVSGVAAGSYVDTVFVMSPDASNGPIPVQVNLTVTPVITYSLVAVPESLSFVTTEGVNPANEAFVVSEQGGANIDFSVAKTAGWINLPATSGTTPDSVYVAVDVSGLTPGTYSDTLMVASASASNSPIKVLVKLEVQTPPPPVALAASPDSLVFNAAVGDPDPDTMYINVTETGGTNIDFSVSDTSAWFDEGGFTSGTTPEMVPVAVHLGSLAQGDYAGTIEISSAAAGNSPIYVNVILHLAGPPNNPPTFVTQFHDTTITECDSLDMMFQAEDQDGDPVVLSMDSLVDNMTFSSDSAGNGEFVFHPSFNQSGVYPLYVHASDGQTTITATFTVTVLDCQPGTEGDTVTVATLSAVPGAQVTVQVDIANQCEVSDIGTYLAWTSNYLTLDSANFADSRLDSLTGKFFTIDNDAHTVSFGQTATEGESIPSGSGNLINLYFSLAVNTPADFYPIDLNGTYPTTYNPQFIRNCGSGDETIQPIFIPGGIVVDTSGNYVCGYVVDPDGNPVPGAHVQLWDNFPGGSVVDSVLASGTGVFAFSDFNTIPFDLWAYKDGYYPGKVQHINFAQSGIMIVLTPYQPVTKTSTNVRFYCDGLSTYMDAPLPVGSVIDAYDPDGVRCGNFFVTTPGQYGFLYVYGDDPYEPGDQGAQKGDVITFYVNGLPAIPSTTPIWTENLDKQDVCLDVPNETTETCHLLKDRWYLISWNLDTPSDDILTVLSSISDCLEVVQGFEQGALTYDDSLPEFSDLWQVDHLSGYWIKVSRDVDLTITGMPVPTTTPIPVTAGWNLVSYLPESSMPTADGFASIMNDLVVAEGSDSLGGMTYDPSNLGHSDLLTLDPCHGYWVKVRNDGELVYPGQGPSLAAQKGTGLQASLGNAFNDVTPTTQWINLYSYDLTVNGADVTAGSRVDAYTENGTKVGSYIMKTNGHFGFMPVYGAEPGSDGLSSGQSFYLTVNDVKTDQSFTWTKSGDKIEINGLTSKSASDEPLPEKFGLHQNYPNPFNPTTTISFSLPAAGKAKIEIFNILGHLVATPFDGTAKSGLNEVVWDGKNSNGETVSSGIYFYRLSADNYNETKKMTLLK